MISQGPDFHDDNLTMTNGSNHMVQPDRSLNRRLSTRFGSESTHLTEQMGRRSSDHDGRVLSLAAYLEVLFVHRRLLLLSILCSFALGWIALLLWPRSFESEAKLMLRVGRESVSLDPTATTSQTLMFQKTQEEEVNGALEILGSRRISELIVKEIGVDAILSGSLPSSATAEPEDSFKANVTWLRKKASGIVDQVILASGVHDEISDHERAVIKTSKSMNVYAPKKSTAITVRAEAKTPEMAQKIVQSLTDHFLEAHVNVSKTNGSLTFFEKQASDSEKKLNGMLQHRSTMLQERKIASVESRHTALASQLGALESTLLSSQSSLKQYLAEIKDLTEKASNSEDEIVATKQMQSDPTFSGMRNSLYDKEMEEKRLGALYQPGHPQLVQIQNQVAAGREVLEKVESAREDKSTTPNPVKIRIEEDLQQTRTAVAGIESLIAETESQRSEKQKEIRELLDFEVELSQLDREIAIAQSSLEILQEKQEEARVIDDLQSQHISSVGIFQPATLVEKAVNPKKSLVAAAFAMLGLFGGIGWVMLRELTSSTLRTPEHVEKSLDCPVLATIPKSRGLKLLHRIVRSNDLADIRMSCNAVLSEVLLSRPQSNHGGFRGKTIGVLGVVDGCGASSVAVGLALASSEDAGLRTTLIDFDLTKRTVSGAFGLNGGPGFAELVAGEAGRDDCTQRFDQRPLSLISGSSTTSNRRIEADPKLVMNTLNELLDENDIVIVDLPPASRPDQTLAIAQHLDQVLVVIESEKTELVAVKRLIRQLESGNADVVGIILNKTRSHLPGWLSSLLR